MGAKQESSRPLDADEESEDRQTYGKNACVLTVESEVRSNDHIHAILLLMQMQTAPTEPVPRKPRGTHGIAGEQ